MLGSESRCTVMGLATLFAFLWQRLDVMVFCAATTTDLRLQPFIITIIITCVKFNQASSQVQIPGALMSGYDWLNCWDKFISRKGKQMHSLRNDALKSKRESTWPLLHARINASMQNIIPRESIPPITCLRHRPARGLAHDAGDLVWRLQHINGETER